MRLRRAGRSASALRWGVSDRAAAAWVMADILNKTAPRWGPKWGPLTDGVWSGRHQWRRQIGVLDEADRRLFDAAGLVDLLVGRRETAQGIGVDRLGATIGFAGH